MRKVELLPTRDCEAGYGPGKDREKDNYYTEMYKTWNKKVHTRSYLYFNILLIKISRGVDSE